jgi:Phycobilisome Linker polypeptide/Domain of unknown function (DUF4214)
MTYMTCHYVAQIGAAIIRGLATKGGQPVFSIQTGVLAPKEHLQMKRTTRFALFLSFFGTMAGQAFAVDFETARKQVAGLYKQILEREPDPEGLSHHAGHVSRGKPLRHVVKEMVCSDEYRERFAKHLNPRELAKRLFVHILCREPESEAVLEAHAQLIVNRGWQACAHHIADGKEARGRYGDDPPVPRDPPRR